MFLCPCEFEFYASDGGEVKHVYDPGLPFPPLKPNAYPLGSAAREQAETYWLLQEEKKQLDDGAVTVYHSLDPLDSLEQYWDDDLEDYLWEDDEEDEDDLWEELISEYAGSYAETYETRFYVVNPE